MAMPWTKAKEKQRMIEACPNERKRLTALFHACFRIQKQACAAASRHIPMVVENVRGAQKWVGRSRWNYGSFHLWGDVPALMPIVTNNRMKFPAHCGPRMWSDREYHRLNDGNASAFHLEGLTNRAYKSSGIKQGGDWFNASEPSISRLCSSKSNARKAASAMIAKIPFELARHIAHCWKPR